jgi:hypothetical protein
MRICTTGGNVVVFAVCAVIDRAYSVICPGLASASLFGYVKATIHKQQFEGDSND